MTVRTFPRIRTLSLTLVILFAALILDLNLKRISVEYSFGEVPHRWLTRAYRSLAATLVNQTRQAQSSADASLASDAQSETKPSQPR